VPSWACELHTTFVTVSLSPFMLWCKGCPSCPYVLPCCLRVGGVILHSTLFLLRITVDVMNGETFGGKWTTGTFYFTRTEGWRRLQHCCTGTPTRDRVLSLSNARPGPRLE